MYLCRLFKAVKYLEKAGNKEPEWKSYINSALCWKMISSNLIISRALKIGLERSLQLEKVMIRRTHLCKVKIGVKVDL